MNKIYDLVEYLQGTCMSLDTACSVFEMDFDDLSFEDFAVIDEAITECSSCGWWVESSDIVNEDNECSDCANY